MPTLDSPPRDPGNVFVRLFLMAAYFLILNVVRFVLWTLILFQWIRQLLGYGLSREAQSLGKSASDYVYRVWLFLTYNTDERPFPFENRRD